VGPAKELGDLQKRTLRPRSGAPPLLILKYVILTFLQYLYFQINGCERVNLYKLSSLCQQKSSQKVVNVYFFLLFFLWIMYFYGKKFPEILEFIWSGCFRGGRDINVYSPLPEVLWTLF